MNYDTYREKNVKPESFDLRIKDFKRVLYKEAKSFPYHGVKLCKQSWILLCKTRGKQDATQGKTKFGKKLMTGLSLCLSGFLLCGTEVNAAEKETPLVNLAEGLTTVEDSNGNPLTNAELLTDEDLYYLQYNECGNKVSGSVVAGHQGSTGWEAYVEQGAQVDDGAKWIQMDLGESYPVEVINLKRRIYDGVGSISTQSGKGNATLRYTDTVIVIGNKADLSDGYVVYYNDDDGSVELPEGVEIPDSVATGGLNESMAGTYFYMDNTIENGTGYTELGTTKNARYIRVYSDDPDADEDLMFMELAVYGYRSEDNIREVRERRVINNEHPLMIAAAYSDDQWYIGQKEGVGLQGYNTIAGRWNTVADDLKDNMVLMMHSNNLRSFAPNHIGQVYIHGYYEACLQEASDADVEGWVAAMTVHGQSRRDVLRGFINAEEFRAGSILL